MAKLRANSSAGRGNGASDGEGPGGDDDGKSGEVEAEQQIWEVPFFFEDYREQYDTDSEGEELDDVFSDSEMDLTSELDLLTKWGL